MRVWRTTSASPSHGDDALRARGTADIDGLNGRSRALFSSPESLKGEAIRSLVVLALLCRLAARSLRICECNVSTRDDLGDATLTAWTLPLCASRSTAPNKVNSNCACGRDCRATADGDSQPLDACAAC